VIPKFIRKKFHGVQVPLGKWILRHIFEFIVLSPAIFLTWLYLKIRKYEVIIVGVASSVISSFLAPLEPELRKRINSDIGLGRTVVINLSVDANTQIRKMYDDIVKIIGDERKFTRRIIWWATKLGVNTCLPSQVQSDPAWRVAPPSVSFTQAENELGKDYLRNVGFSERKFVCYATRSESYYARLIEQGVVVKPRSVRNPDEKIYLRVANRLAEENLAIIRMGKDLDTKIAVTDYPNVLDYAASSRTDFLDCFLMKNCKFAFIGNTGIVWFRWLFNLPNVHCDVYDIRYTQMTNDISIFQKVWLIREKRLATISEMLKMKSEYSDERHQARLGVELVKNTADEIYSACQEMNTRIDGNWDTTPEDEVLQKRYLDLVIKYSDQPTWRGGGRVGAQFLRDNQNLLR
jgi:putative glycosyltransferase (TIGR04372 family)